jgi:glycosyltransferase involved in cell wall biosynthesis
MLKMFGAIPGQDMPIPPKKTLRVMFYMPFKPLGHPNPSGDLVIGSSLYTFLHQNGHCVRLASRLRLRWFYWKPNLWLRLLWESAKVLKDLRRNAPDLWLTYHSYYKAPDVLGALCTLIRPLPYVIFQGVYATKRRRHWKTWPGFRLNRWALSRTRTVFTNKHVDEINLKRLLPADRIQYIPPGIDTVLFQRDPAARLALRATWDCGPDPVILTAAMFRPGVKTEGLEIIIQACGCLKQKGYAFHLVICGEGATGAHLRKLACQQRLGDRITFTGKIGRQQMNRFYSAADVFAFPGIQEGLGLVYLEAQACGLPVVAYNRWGAAEVVRDGLTGLLCSPEAPGALEEALACLVQNSERRRQMGAAAQRHVRTHHNQTLNLQRFESLLKQLVETPK